MKAFVDHDVCIGCGLCASMCEQVFSMNDEGLSQPIADAIPAELLDDAQEACGSCPVDAISIEE